MAGLAEACRWDDGGVSERGHGRRGPGFAPDHLQGGRPDPDLQVTAAAAALAVQQYRQKAVTLDAQLAIGVCLDPGVGEVLAGGHLLQEAQHLGFAQLGASSTSSMPSSNRAWGTAGIPPP